MSEIKDKKIAVYEIQTDRNTQENEIKVKHYIHSRNNLWAYVREISDKEKFTAKSVGSETSIMFKINYNAKIKAGLYLEFKGETYIIESVDGYEYYKRDLTLRARRTEPEAIIYEQYDEF